LRREKASSLTDLTVAGETSRQAREGCNRDATQ